MSRYEKINYDELEMLAANGGIETDVDFSITKQKYCPETKSDMCQVCSKISKTVSRTVSLVLTRLWDCNGFMPIAPPEEMHPFEP